MRTDRSLAFYEGDDNPNVNVLRDILLTYSFYNFDLGYCQVTMQWILDLIVSVVNIIYLEHQNFDLILFGSYELSCLIKQRIFYVFTTAGRSFLIAIIFLNQVYFETMNHYASLLFSYAVFLPFSCLIKQRIILYPLSGKEYLISYYLLNQVYFETMNIMPLCFHMLSSSLSLV